MLGIAFNRSVAQRSEASANLFRKELRLFPCRIVPAFIDLVVIHEFVIRPLRLTHNGLRTLSGVDVRGYFATVSKPAYRLNFFVASLVKTVPCDPNAAGTDRSLPFRPRRRQALVGILL
jgi:hypothetical protein